MTTTYIVKFNGQEITLNKTERDLKLEKKAACIEILRSKAEHISIEQKTQAKRLLRELIAQLERGYR
jgi:hypothetical protein